MPLAQTFTFETGRDYGAPQVLTIEVPGFTYDENGDAFVDIVFRDPVRSIDGVVEGLMLWEGLTADRFQLARAVLTMYDLGEYKTL